MTESKSSKLPLIFFLVCFVALAAYGYNIYRHRNNPTQETKQNSTTSDNSVNSPEVTDDLGSGNDKDNQATISPANDTINTEDEDAGEATADEKNNFLDVSKSDCNNNCKDFSDPEDRKYCVQVCGLEPIKKETKKKKDCSDLQDLEKDYCFKDLAINKNDIKTCSEIEDTDIKKVCQNRITQNLLETQN